MKPKHLWLIALTLALLAPKFSLSQCGLHSSPSDSVVCGERTQLGVYADWESISSGTTVSLNAVYFPSASVGYACGNGGVLLKSTDGGKTFNSLSTPINNNLNALHFISEDTGIAVGTNGSILRTTNGGTSWTQPSSGTSQNLKTIFFFNSQTAYVGGELGTLLKTVDVGVSWNASSNGITSTPNDMINSVHFPELQIGYAGVLGDMYKTTNGGASWSKITTYWPVNYKSILFLNRDTGFVCLSAGSNAILRTVDGGTNWISMKTENYLQLNQIVRDASNNLMVFGGGVWSSNDLGENWIYHNTGPLSDFSNYNLLFLGGSSTNNYKGITVGISGAIYRNRHIDSVSWYPVSGLSDTLTTNPWANPTDHTTYIATAYIEGCMANAYLSVFVHALKVDPRTHYLISCGDSIQLDARANIAPTPGMSYNWTPTKYLDNAGIQNPKAKVLESVNYQLIAITSNGCVDTAQVTISLDFHAAIHNDMDVFCGDKQFIEPDTLQWGKVHTSTQASYVDIQFVNDQVGFVAAMNAVQKTTDGGKTWSTNAVPLTYFIRSIHFRNEQLGFATAISSNLMRDVILKTTNGGNSWTTFDPGVAYQMPDIYFVSDLVGYAIANQDKILKTVNGGLSWQPINSNATSPLASIHFPGNLVGYAVGNDGFVVKTTDGGTNWTNIGQLKQYVQLKGVHFISEDTGFVIGDRYVWTTTNGGNSWIKQGIEPDQSLDYFNSGICFIDAKTGIISTEYRHGLGTPKYYGGLYMTFDGGTSWQKMDIDSANIFKSVYANKNGLALVCGENGSLYKRLNAPNTYSWSPSAGLSNPSIRNPFIEPANNTQYILTAHKGSCFVKDTINIHVVPLVIDAGPDQQLVCGDSILLTPRTVFMDIDASSAFYSWQITDANDSIIFEGVPFQRLSGYFALPQGHYFLSIHNSAQVNPIPINVRIVPLHGKPVTLSINEVADSLIVREFIVPDYSNYSFNWQPAAGRIDPNFTAKNYLFEIITPQGCKASDSLRIEPIALVLDAGSDKYITCGMSVQLDSLISNVSATVTPLIQWTNSSLLDNPNSKSPIASPTNTTWFKASMNAGNGCLAYDSVLVTIEPLNVLVADVQVYCKDTVQIQLQTNYSGVQPLEYLWSPNIDIDSVNSASPKIIGLVNRAYTVRLKTWNGCEVNDSVFVNLMNPPAPKICIVGVNEFDKNQVVWNKGEGRIATSFDILRETNVSNNFVKIGSVLPADDYVFSDSTSFPFVQSNRYKIAYFDACGLYSVESDHHQTMHLTINKGIGNTWNLIWNSYEGFIVNTYNIYRGTSIDNLQQIGTSSGSNNSYSDLNAPTGDIFYQVELIGPDNCNPLGKSYNSSRSNKASNKPLLVDDFSDHKNILLYPNPAREFLNIVVSEPHMPEAYTIKLVNMLGQTILNLPVKAEDQISLRGIPEGVYVYQIEENSLLIQNGKLHIQRD